jgi:hypothetical protein
MVAEYKKLMIAFDLLTTAKVLCRRQLSIHLALSGGATRLDLGSDWLQG